jgi:hypothetical protein
VRITASAYPGDGTVLLMAAAAPDEEAIDPHD